MARSGAPPPACTPMPCAAMAPAPVAESCAYSALPDTAGEHTKEKRAIHAPRKVILPLGSPGASDGSRKEDECDADDQYARSASPSFDSAAEEVGVPPKPEARMHDLISKQQFAGNWVWSAELLRLLELTEDKAQTSWKQDFCSKDVWITLLVIAYFRKSFADEQETWELIIDKAREWVTEQGVDVEKGLGLVSL